MSTSLVSTVLEIEREAEAILHKAGQEAERIVADSRVQRETACKAHSDAIAKQIAEIEAAAAADRARKVKELAASGEAALSAVRNISDAAFSGGVQHIMNALAGK